MILLWFSAWLLDPASVKPQKTYIVPLAIEDEDDPRTYLNTIDQIVIDGDLLYLNPTHSSVIKVFDRDLKFLFQIGGHGGGPGLFPTAIHSFTAANGNVWAFCKDTQMSYFQGDHFVRNIPLKGVQVSVYGGSTAAFAADEDVVVIPAHPKTRRLGVVHAYDGKVVQGVGDIFPIDKEVLARNPAYNDVMWVKGKDRWYAVFEYHPLVQVFDRAFKLVSEFAYDTQAVKEFEERWGDWKPKKGWRIPFEMNYDAAWHDGHLWIMCFGALLKIDPETKSLSGAWHFYGQDPEYDASGRHHFYTFDFFSDGQMVMATRSNRWGHIFTANLD